MLQVYVRCFSTSLRVHHQSHVRYATNIQFLAMFLHGLLNNRTWTGNGIENCRARVQR